MKLTRGRIVQASSLVDEAPYFDRDPRVAAEVVRAHEEAERILQEARDRAGHLEAEVRERLGDVVRRAAEEARELELARLSAAALHLEARARRLEGDDMERLVAFATLLAERVVGAELALEGARIAAMAEELLAESGGSGSVRIEVHPDDAEALRRHFASLGLPAGTCAVEAAPELLRGSLVLHGDLGTVDGRLESRLPRLAAALREALRHG